MNFGVESAFSKDAGFTFAEGPGPSLGPLYKICPGNLGTFFRRACYAENMLLGVLLPFHLNKEAFEELL